VHSRARLNMEPKSKSSWGGSRIGAGRPTEPSSRRARRKDGEFMERLTFIRDVAGDVAKDNIKNWKGWPGSAQLHAHALQQDLEDVILRLDALLGGDAAPFEGAEFRDWRSRRSPT
jgi:hypothetical protein